MYNLNSIIFKKSRIPAIGLNKSDETAKFIWKINKNKITTSTKTYHSKKK